MEALATSEMIGVNVSTIAPKKAESAIPRKPAREASVTNLAEAMYDVSPMPFARDRDALRSLLKAKLIEIKSEDRAKVLSDLCIKSALDAQTLLSEKNYSRAQRATDMLLLLTKEANTSEIYTLAANVLLSQLADTSIVGKINLHDNAKANLRTILPHIIDEAVQKQCEAVLKEPEKPPSVKSEKGFTSLVDLFASFFRRKQLKTI